MHPVCTMLHETIKPLIDQKYDGNIRKAAKYIDVEYNLAYRLYQGQQKSLDFFAALKLAKVTGLSSDGSVLREFYPAEFEDLGSLVSDSAALDDFVAGLEFAVESPLRYEVLLYSSEIKGVTVTAVEKEFGSRGVRAVEELVAKKMLALENDGSISSIYSKDHWGPDSICLKVANANLKMVQLDRPGSFIRNHALALNSKGLVEYYKAHRGFANELAAIEKNSKYAGKDIVVSGLVMGPISSASRSEGVSNEN